VKKRHNRVQPLDGWLQYACTIRRVDDQDTVQDDDRERRVPGERTVPVQRYLEYDEAIGGKVYSARHAVSEQE
jgi:hypothetical protein